MEMEGRVESVNQAETWYLVKIGGVSAGGRGKCPVKPNEYAKMVYEEGKPKEKGGRFLDVVKIEKVAPKRETPSAPRTAETGERMVENWREYSIEVFGECLVDATKALGGEKALPLTIDVACEMYRARVAPMYYFKKESGIEARV